MNGIQDISQKIINRGVLMRFAGNPHVYQAPKSNCCSCAACAIGAHEALFSLLTDLLLIVLEITHVKLYGYSKPQYST